MRKKLKEMSVQKKMEDAFPDFIELMASNLRAGMTIDKALLLSARREFAPLDKEIFSLGKDIMTGKKVEAALNAFAIRTKSAKIQKTVNLIISGIKSGGNISILLEEAAVNMRERNFVEKRAASNVLMYVIFIFFSIAVGAPALFALSSVLVSVLTNILSTIPVMSSTIALPFSLTKINISVTFITYFSIVFIIATDILASLMLGLVSKGQEKSGIKYIPILLIISILTFIVLRVVLMSYFSDIFK
jgi:flagellar protein FlaJ